MKVAITGGTGFLGQELALLLRERGDEVRILTRHPKGPNDVEWLQTGSVPEGQLIGTDAFINLAGASINDGRWSKKQQREIYKSRMDATQEVLRIIRSLPEAPRVLVNASAVGIYPASETATYTEASTATASDFLAETVRDWEQLAAKAKQSGTRAAMARFGVMLGKDGGALPLMALPYRLFTGGKVGSGRQWLSWIHLHDAARAVIFAIDNGQVRGPFNVTAPSPRRMTEFGRELGRALGRPHWFPVPAIALKLALGDKSRLVLEGQRVIPDVLLRNGFEFRFPDLPVALRDIYS
ncbi:TIGR01777 family oxidoreductase [Planococcus lenghuensis]|uniref:TIGR01777 family protein n=1 Tax=Planococcus lenghuensis TaxID=2213202 RepID=A0A1Q2KXV5_9BACL|nr:TIGR01777 family oxidoreductase [Planococcus lenghuensis]AQQ52492.1 TIGR01777 family protein [Planococcus lenghuensis]